MILFVTRYAILEGILLDKGGSTRTLVTRRKAGAEKEKQSFSTLLSTPSNVRRRIATTKLGFDNRPHNQKSPQKLSRGTNPDLNATLHYTAFAEHRKISFVPLEPVKGSTKYELEVSVTDQIHYRTRLIWESTNLDAEAIDYPGMEYLLPLVLKHWVLSIALLYLDSMDGSTFIWIKKIYNMEKHKTTAYNVTQVVMM
ncbi:hypothetical protein BDQ17DRAFT_1332814 [Cyathus striatus]|nr:hypothetical protein BDQ17DRAFT_1332814 [Cyathus striatus]